MNILTWFRDSCRKVWSFVCINTLHCICCCILCVVWSCWCVSLINHFIFWWHLMVPPPPPPFPFYLLFSAVCRLQQSLHMVINLHFCFQLRWGCHFCNSRTWTQWGTSSSQALPSSWVCLFPSISGNTQPRLFMVLLIPVPYGWVNNLSLHLFPTIEREITTWDFANFIGPRNLMLNATPPPISLSQNRQVPSLKLLTTYVWLRISAIYYYYYFSNIWVL